MKKLKGRINTPALLLGMYGFFVLLRFVLALLTSIYPLVDIDEFLYYGMARSIANGEGLTFRGQPADYSYILYSLVLSPVYLTGLKGPVLYRAMQLWNILLITLSIFPFYRIAAKCVGDERKALWLTGISMLLPDFLLGQLMMAENVIIPLFYTLFCLILDYLENEKLWKILLIGLIGGLLFSAKPGAVIPAAVFFILLLVFSLAKRDIKQFPRIGAGAAVMIAAAGFFFLLVKLLNGNASVLSLYEIQVTDTAHSEVFFRFIGVYILYIFIACGFGCVFLLGKKFAYFSFDRKFFLYVLLISLIMMIIGVSWSVNRYEYTANTAHMRYIGMYIPLLFIFSMIPVSDTEIKQGSLKNIPVSAVILFGIFSVLLFVLGIYSGVNLIIAYSENMTLSMLVLSLNINIPSVFIVLLLLCLCLFFLILTWKKNISIVERFACIVLLSVFLLNGYSAYRLISSGLRNDFTSDAEKLQAALPEETDPLFIYSAENLSFYYVAMDVYSPKDISYVTFKNIFNHLDDSQGVYKPFVPNDMRGVIPVCETPETDTLFLDHTAYMMLKLSDNTEHLTFNNKDGLHLVRIKDKNERWLDWVIGNTQKMTLAAGNKGILLLYNQDYLKSPLTFRFTASVDSDTVFSMNSNLEIKTVQLTAGLHEYEVTFESPQDAYNFNTDAGDLRFYNCELINK